MLGRWLKKLEPEVHRESLFKFWMVSLTVAFYFHLEFMAAVVDGFCVGEGAAILTAPSFLRPQLQAPK